MGKRIKLFLLLFCAFTMAGSIRTYAGGFSISQNAATMNIGDVLELNVSGADKAPVWVSYNENTAKVDQNGAVTALRAGKTTIRARSGFNIQTCAVKVVNSSIKLNKAKATIYHGGTSVNTVQLKASVKGAAKDVVWKSSDINVAGVDTNGKVTSVSEGTAIITATANGKTAGCTVTVKESSITLNMDTMQLGNKGTGSHIKLVPSIVGSKKSVKWVSSDKTVATVSNGKVTGKKNGTATVTATANGVSDTCTVIVTEGLVSVNEEKVFLYTGGTKPETKQLKTNAGKKDVLVWGSSDENIATVENGLVTAKGEGTAIISVECGGKIDTCEVIVKNTVTEIKEDTVYLRTKGSDKTYQLNNSITGRNSSVKWISSDNKVVSVSKGKLTAKKAGTATVTATANGVSDSVQVAVEEYLPTIKLNHKSYVLYTSKGNTLTLKATVGGKSKTVSWNSSNEEVATVSNKGKVAAVSGGETIISATANGVTAECLITVRESRVILESENLHLDKGGKGNIPVDVIGVSQTVKWSTTNRKVATVKNGVVTAKNYGEATIKATANGITSICRVSVSECQHNFDEGTVTKEPSCTEEGTRLYTCTVCGYTYTGHIPTVEHKWGDWMTTKEATEMETGIQVRTCTVCGTEETSFLPVLDHTHKYETAVTEPTCTEEGYTTYKCSCGDIYTDNVVPALGHKWSGWQVVQEPTEKESGTKLRVCTVCKAEETESIPVIGHEHKYSTTVISPTCTEDGYTTYVCSCGDTYRDNIVPALGHKWGEWQTVKEATEKESGTKLHVCTVCKVEETESIPVIGHGHKYSTTVVNPTCTEDGYTVYECSCGESYKDNVVHALGHKWGEWQTVKESTESEAGEKQRVCSTCGAEETGSIPVLEHTHKYTATIKAPTCTEQGYTAYTCQCGDLYTSDYTDILGHDSSDWTITKEPTCTEDGWKVKKCSRCGLATEEAIVFATGHSYDEGSITQKPTCTESGEKTYTCTACGDTRTETMEASGHTYGEFETITEPQDFETFGTAKMVCPACDTVLFDNLTAVLVDAGNGETAVMYGSYDKEEAKKCFALTYQYKEENGFFYEGCEYKWDDDKYNLSCVRCAEMAYEYNTVGVASHSRPGGGEIPGWGENLTYRTQTGNQSIGCAYPATKAYDDWMNSRGHKDNIECGSNETALAQFMAWIPEYESWAVFWVQNFY